MLDLGIKLAENRLGNPLLPSLRVTLRLGSNRRIKEAVCKASWCGGVLNTLQPHHETPNPVVVIMNPGRRRIPPANMCDVIAQVLDGKVGERCALGIPQGPVFEEPGNVEDVP